MNAQVNYVSENQAFTLTLLLQGKVLHPFLPKPCYLDVLKSRKGPSLDCYDSSAASSHLLRVSE